MDHQLSPDEAAAMFGIKRPITMGRTVSLERLPEPSAPRSGEDTYREFVKLAKADASYLDRLAAAFSYQHPFAIAKPVEPMPIKRVSTIEASFDDKGNKKVARVRADKAAMRFHAKLQVCVGSDRQVSAPSWTGYTAFRTPLRAAKDAATFHRQKSFSDAYKALIDDLVEAATANDLLIGFLRAATDSQGTPHLDGQVIVASREGLERHELDSAMIFALDDAGMLAIKLPGSSKLTSAGKPLKAGFDFQCRAIRQIGQSTKKQEWATGFLEVIRP